MFSLCVLSCGNDKNVKRDKEQNLPTHSKGEVYESEGYTGRGEWAI